MGNTKDPTALLIGNQDALIEMLEIKIKIYCRNKQQVELLPIVKQLKDKNEEIFKSL